MYGNCPKEVEGNHKRKTRKVAMRGKLALVTFLAVMTAVPLLGQTRCNDLVVDEAGVLGGDPKLTASAHDLVNQGADVKVRTVRDMGTPTLDVYEKQMEQSCPSWQSPDGGRKNNLLVFLVATQNRKVGMYYGSQWRPALDNQWPRIQSEFMAPRFRDKDFAGGLTAGIEQAKQLIYVHAHVQTASGPVVVNTGPPTDYSGLWRVLGWLVVIVFVLGTGIGVYVVIGHRKESEDEVKGAQQDAVLARQRAADALNRVSAKLAELLPRYPSTLAKANGWFDQVSENYNELRTSGVSDPGQEGLTLKQYRAIASAYRDIADSLQGIEGQIQQAIYGKDGESKRAAVRKTPPKEEPVRTSANESRPSEPEARREPTGSPIIAPVFIDNSTRIEETRSEETHHHHEEESHRDDDSSGGSSDFGSGSSDSGGGGGFDFGFGGGGDSGGGGGSSDW